MDGCMLCSTRLQLALNSVETMTAAPWTVAEKVDKSTSQFSPLSFSCPSFCFFETIPTRLRLLPWQPKQPKQ